MPIEKPETLRVRSCRCYAFGCKCEIVAILGGGGASDDSRLAVYQTLSVECHSSIFFRHMLCVIVVVVVVVVFFFFFFFFFFFMLSLELVEMSL